MANVSSYNNKVVIDSASGRAYIVLANKTWYIDAWSEITAQQHAAAVKVAGADKFAKGGNYTDYLKAHPVKQPVKVVASSASIAHQTGTTQVVANTAGKSTSSIATQVKGSATVQPIPVTVAHAATIPAKPVSSNLSIALNTDNTTPVPPDNSAWYIIIGIVVMAAIFFFIHKHK